MVGLIMGAAGAAAGLAASLIPDKEITTEYKSYSPDPMSIRNAGLFNTSVNLGEQTFEETTYETPMAKKILGGAAMVLGAGGGLADGLSGEKSNKTNQTGTAATKPPKGQGAPIQNLAGNKISTASPYELYTNDQLPDNWKQDKYL